jgi:Fe-S-cluster-containing dehydrogenase component/CRP-like cAMP-binding protein
MSAAISSRAARFPERVWDVPVLRSLDARSRSELEAAGRLRDVRANDVVFRAGDPADVIYVVVEGACTIAAVRRGDTETTVLRRVRAGEVFGEEAIVDTFSTRAFEARAEENTRLAEIPVPVLLRAVGRGGDGEVVGRLERALRRAATFDLVRATAFGRRLSDRELETVVDAVRHIHLARGEYLYRDGDASTEAFFVADGLLSAQTIDEGKPRVEAYLSRGDLFGEDELESREPRRLSVVAAGPAWLVALPRDVYRETARKSGGALDGTRRLRALPVLQAPRGANTTAHVFQDVYRLRVARSLLVIDQDSCIRCGHCAWSCASVHDDGIARLVRHGDKVIVQQDERAAPLLVPNSCQHCKNPACMIDCPTGAIGRDARGEVFIREDLCTGCGACAKACPWDNIQIAKRTHAKYPEVAVKCDLCAGSAAGPACVSACPTEAIARVDPNQDFAELRALSKATRIAGNTESNLPPRSRTWPALAGAACAAIGIALVPLGKTSSGWSAAGAFMLLLAYSAAKRAPRLVARAKLPGFARMLYVAHAAIGIVLAGITFTHTGTRLPQNAAGALLLAFLSVVVTGALGALLNIVVPPRLSRLERSIVLPEELATRGRDLDERIFEKLSGRTELVKTLFGKVLRPYRRARFGALLLAVSGRSLRKEEKRVRATIDGLLEGKKSDRLNGLDDLVRLVVERRALGAQAILTRVLRGWLPIHLAATGAAIVLLVLHVIAVWGRP